MNPRNAILKKTILTELAASRGLLVKRDALLALINFSADPVCLESEYSLVLADLERNGRITVVRNEDTGQLKLRITDNGLAALADMA